MSLQKYFDKAKGLGVLATTDADGQCNTAVYSRPYFTEDGDEKTVAFIMADHKSHANVAVNPKAAYLFKEDGEGYAGVRLTLTKVAEETDPEKIAAIRRKPSCCCGQECKSEFLVTFRVEEERPLVGD